MRPLAAFVLLALLSGCCELPFRPSDIAVDAPAVGGLSASDSTAKTIVIRVLAPDEPMDGVPVYVFWEDSSGLSGSQTRLVALGLRTADGIVTARVPDRTIHVAAGGEVGWTEEWIADAIPYGSDINNVTVRIYPTTVAGNFTGTWTPAAASVYKDTGFAMIAWLPQEVPIDASPEAQVGYAQRLRGVRATITWENAPTVQADLGIALWQSDGLNGAACTFSDKADDLGTVGARSDSFDSAVDDYYVDCEDYDSARGDDATILIGPATGRPALMPFGLAYHVDYSMDFGYQAGIEALCERLDADADVSSPDDEESYSEPEIVVAYMAPENGTVGPDQYPSGATVNEITPGLGLPLIALALLFVALLVRRAP